MKDIVKASPNLIRWETFDVNTLETNPFVYVVEMLGKRSIVVRHQHDLMDRNIQEFGGDYYDLSWGVYSAENGGKRLEVLDGFGVPKSMEFYTESRLEKVGFIRGQGEGFSKEMIIGYNRKYEGDFVYRVRSTSEEVLSLIYPCDTARVVGDREISFDEVKPYIDAMIEHFSYNI